MSWVNVGVAGAGLIASMSNKDKTKSRSTRTLGQDQGLESLLRMFASEGGGSANPLTSREMLSLEALEQQSLNRAGGEVAGESDEALLEILRNRGSSGADFEDFFQTSIQDPALQDFQRSIMPQIGRDFGGSSFFSGERQEADRTAREDLLTTLTRSRSELAFRDREGSTDRLMKALGLSQDIETSRTNNILNTLQGFGVERKARETRIDQILQALGLGARENIVQTGGLGSDIGAGLISAGAQGLLAK